jgi:hypothetical protein
MTFAAARISMRPFVAKFRFGHRNFLPEALATKEQGAQKKHKGFFWLPSF